MTTTQDTNPVIIPSSVNIATEWLTIVQYAAAQVSLEHPKGIHPRTVKRWLAAGELPEAQQDAKGQWWIPSHSTRQVKQQPLARFQPAEAEVEPEPEYVEPTSQEVARVEASLVMSPVLSNVDALPSFLTVEQAALLLAPATAYSIRNNPDYYNAIKHGPNGQILIPLSTVKRIRGVM